MLVQTRDRGRTAGPQLVRGGERMVTPILSPSPVPYPHCLRQANLGLKQSQAVPLPAPQCHSSPPQGQLRRTVSRHIVVSARGLRNEVTGVPMETVSGCLGARLSPLHCPLCYPLSVNPRTAALLQNPPNDQLENSTCIKIALDTFKFCINSFHL